MKRTPIRKQRFWLAALAALSLTACKKELNPGNEAEANAPSATTLSSAPCGIDYREDSVGYALCHLTQAGAESVKSFSRQRDRLYSIIETQFDGEYNALIATLVQAGLPVTQELQQELAAFRDINGNTYYPQIYIPYFEELKKAQLLGRKNPVIVPFASQAADDERYTGYQVDAQGGLQRLDVPMDSLYASRNEVWVISLNESVNNQGQLEPDETGAAGGAASGRMQGNVNCRINKMTVKEHKESWVAGKSEIAIRAYLWYYNGGADVISNSTTFDLLGKKITEFKRKEVNNQNEKTLNWTIQTSWAQNSYTADPICFGYVIFERDIWPTGTRTDYVNIPSSSPANTRYWTYRSADNFYSIGTLYNMPYSNIATTPSHQDKGQSNGITINRSGIKFNTQHY